MSNVPAILKQIDAELSALLKARAILTDSKAPGKRGRPKGSAVAKSAKKRTMSPEGRARVAEAQRRRWAAQKKA